MYGIPNLVIAALAAVLLVGLYGASRYRKRKQADPDSEPAERAAGVGSAAGKGIKTVIDGWLVGIGAFIYGFLKWVPKSGAIGDSLMNAGAKVKKRKGDVLINVIYGDGVVVPRSATWKSKERHFETGNGEQFSARGIGFDPKRLNGKIPVVWALRASAEVTEPLEAAIANARKLGRFEPFQRASGEPDVAVDIDPNGFEFGPGVGRPGRQEPVPDGGHVGQAGAVGAAVRGAQARAAQADHETNYKGQIISFREGFELFGSKVTEEDMKNQEVRGKLAALNVKDWGGNWKYILALLAAFALGLFGPGLAAQIASGAGGVIEGGGPNIPIWLLPGVGF